MKKLFLFLVLPLMTFGQDDPLHTGELIIELINNGSSWNDVTFTATAVTERWDENYYLTSDYETATDLVQYPAFTAYFDLTQLRHNDIKSGVKLAAKVEIASKNK